MYVLANFIAVLLFFTAEYSVTALLPLHVTENLGLNPNFSGVVIGTLSVSAIVSKLISGVMADRFGRIRLYRASFLCVAVAVFFYGVASGIAVILIVRLFHGFTSGAVRAIYQSVTATIVSRANMGFAIGVIGLAAMIAMMFVSPLSISFAEKYSFTAVFFVLAFIYILASFAAFFVRLPEVKSNVALNVRSIIEKEIVAVASMKFVSAMCYGLFLSYGILHAKNTGGINPGMIITMYALANIIVRPISGFILDRVNLRGVMLLSYVFLFSGYMMFAQGALLHGAFVIGIGAGIEYTAVNSCALRAVPVTSFSRATAMIELFFSLGLAFSSIVTGLFYKGSFPALFTAAAALNILPLLALVFFSDKIIKNAAILQADPRV